MVISLAVFYKTWHVLFLEILNNHHVLTQS